MGSETITINTNTDYWIDNNMNTGSVADFGNIVLTGGTSSTGIDTISITSDTITFGDYEYANVTKAEHNELIGRVAKLEAMLAEEADIRANHPAVKTAYDEYRLLLVLAKQHTGDDLTAE